MSLDWDPYLLAAGGTFFCLFSFLIPISTFKLFFFVYFFFLGYRPFFHHPLWRSYLSQPFDCANWKKVPIRESYFRSCREPDSGWVSLEREGCVWTAPFERALNNNDEEGIESSFFSVQDTSDSGSNVIDDVGCLDDRTPQRPRPTGREQTFGSGFDELVPGPRDRKSVV